MKLSLSSILATGAALFAVASSPSMMPVGGVAAAAIPSIPADFLKLIAGGGANQIPSLSPDLLRIIAAGGSNGIPTLPPQLLKLIASGALKDLPTLSPDLLKAIAAGSAVVKSGASSDVTAAAAALPSLPVDMSKLTALYGSLTPQQKLQLVKILGSLAKTISNGSPTDILDLGSSLLAFYRTLTPEQKQLAVEIFTSLLKQLQIPVPGLRHRELAGLTSLDISSLKKFADMLTPEQKARITAMIASLVTKLNLPLSSSALASVALRGSGNLGLGDLKNLYDQLTPEQKAQLQAMLLSLLSQIAKN